jgi:hypothetical protein
MRIPEQNTCVQYPLNSSAVDRADFILNGRGKRRTNSFRQGELVRTTALSRIRSGRAQDGPLGDHDVEIVIEDSRRDSHAPHAAERADEVPTSRGYRLI